MAGFNVSVVGGGLRRGYLLLELEVEVSAVLLQEGFPFGGLLPSQLQAQLPIRLQSAHIVLLLVQQVLHLLLVHLHSPPTSPQLKGHAKGGVRAKGGVMPKEGSELR